MFRGKFDFKKKLSTELVCTVNEMRDSLPIAKRFDGKIIIVCGSPFIANIANTMSHYQISDAKGIVIAGGKSPAYKIPHIFTEGLGALVFAELNNWHLNKKITLPYNLSVPESIKIWNKYEEVAPDKARYLIDSSKVCLELKSGNTYENLLNSKPAYEQFSDGKNTPIVVIADESMIVRARQTAKTIFPNTIIESVSFPSPLLYPYTREWQDTFVGRSYIMSDIFAMARYSGLVASKNPPKYPIKLDAVTKAHVQKILELTR